jgi:hypothetical protein
LGRSEPAARAELVIEARQPALRAGRSG